MILLQLAWFQSLFEAWCISVCGALKYSYIHLIIIDLETANEGRSMQVFKFIIILLLSSVSRSHLR